MSYIIAASGSGKYYFHVLCSSYYLPVKQLRLPKELGGMGVVNVPLKIKAQIIKFITRLSLE